MGKSIFLPKWLFSKKIAGQVSALASAFVDNIPLTTMMVKIVISLAENEALGLPLHPLVWALALGACLGG